jgi:hypothetical protein
MINFVNELGKRLEQVMGAPRFTAATENWGNPVMMSRALARVERNFTAPHVMSDSDRRSVAEAVLRFRNSRQLKNYQETKYVCIGASQEFSGWCLLQDPELREMLLQRSSVGSDRQRLKYFSCLLSSYWSFPRDAKETSAASRIGWVRLRDWLNAQRLYLDRSVESKPLWLSTLNDHANLLAEQPCKRYGQELLQGMSASLNEALENLDVSSDSWLRNEAIYAQMQAGAELADMQFQSCLPRLMDAASGKSEFRLSRSISIRCLALLVSRYAACASTPEYIPLRDATIAFIGNPWLHRATWDAYVVDSAGRPDDRAREMVNGWLKVRLIKDFFGLLSEDRSVDERRLNYWLGFEPIIRDMWFALGADALSDPRREYVEFRQRANGRLLQLVGSTPTSNNAFLMHLGEYLVVEFGIAGNACFVYRYDRLPPRIKVRLTSANSGALVDIAELKARGRDARFLHNGSWEPNFDAALCPLLGFTPSGFVDLPPARRTAAVRNSPDQGVRAPSHMASTRRRSFSRLEFDAFRSSHGLDVEDLGAKGGCLWVRTDAADPQINERLKNWGFAYRPTMGWWKE